MDGKWDKKSLQNLVEERREELVELCSRLVQIPSVNPPGQMKEIYALIAEYLKAAGIQSQQVGPNPQRQSLVAEVGTDGGKVFVFNGHADVVPPGPRERWDYDPFGGQVTESQILGRGATDMKGGLAAALFTLCLFSNDAARLGGKIKLHIVPDEESGGAEGSKWLVENGYAKGALAALVAEPTSPTNCEVGQKSSMATTISTYGRSAHGSLGRYGGESAIKHMLCLLPKLERLEEIKGRFLPQQQHVLEVSKEIVKNIKIGSEGAENIIDHVTVNIGTIQGGTRANMVPDYCTATVDIRVPIGVDNEEVMQKIDDIVKEIGLPEGRIKVEYRWSARSNYTDEGEEIVKLCTQNAKEVFGINCVPAYQWPASDARYYRAAGIPTIQFGPSNAEGIHGYNESVDIDDLVKTAKVYAGILWEFFALR